MLQISPYYRTFFLRLHTYSTAESRIKNGYDVKQKITKVRLFLLSVIGSDIQPMT